MTEKQIAEIAAREAARAVADRLGEEQKRRRDGYVSCVRTLLGNYATLQSFCASAVYEATYTAERVSFQDLMEDLMTPDKDVSAVVEAIQRSAQRTKAVYQHITAMLEAYRRRCNDRDSPAIVRRRWRVIERVFISRQWLSIEKAAAAEKVSERVIYQDIQTACEELAPYFFGVDALN